ncbi:hypothetical protein BZM27_40685 [Paraburkholderia steynii]|uniref:Uncharacterized protein n=1 Tax=Paraburkholderia steynii TaxID=1245441 RepID=A0A4R0XBW2_9BURK|nr:hypothetical protein BZM27_40685 [Paraburkholderia steynii]
MILSYSRLSIQQPRRRWQGGQNAEWPTDPIMATGEIDARREHRIMMEIVLDTYTEEETAFGCPPGIRPTMAGVQETLNAGTRVRIDLQKTWQLNAAACHRAG